MPGPTGSHERGEFTPTQISPSRVNSYVSCGQAFKMRYIDGLPEERSGSAALFGTVVHHALERWALNREQSLVTLVAQAWMAVTEGTPVADFIRAYQSISVECMKAEKAARDTWEADKRNAGKKSKAPRMTKYFKESDAAKKLNRLLAEWIPKLNAESPWQFSEFDPLPSLYDESLVAAKRYAIKWRSLPPALYTEFGFTVEWEGFQLKGYIDCIEPVVSPEGELVGILVLDYKTYRAVKSEAKDWRQTCLYDVAIADLKARGVLDLPDVPVYVGCDYFRLTERRDWLMTPADHAKLLDELQMYSRGVAAGVFLPAEKNRNPDFCDYPSNCCLRGRGDETCQRGGLYTDSLED